MELDECWMTFSEALESYLAAREAARSVGPGAARTDFEAEMADAAAHLDALTARSAA